MAGKLFVYALIFVMLAFFLEYFEIVDIPYFELPDFIAVKKTLIQKSAAGLGGIK